MLIGKVEIPQNLGARVDTGGGTDKVGGVKAQTWLAADLPDLTASVF